MMVLMMVIMIFLVSRNVSCRNFVRVKVENFLCSVKIFDFLCVCDDDHDYDYDDTMTMMTMMTCDDDDDVDRW